MTMNILFLTMSDFYDINDRTIYTDLMRKFRDEGHNVYIVTPRERRHGRPTEDVLKDGVHVLWVKTLNLFDTNLIEKGLGQVSIEYLYSRAIKKHFSDVSFNLILYSTPPITLLGVIKEMKRLHPKAKSYLMLKDIFPQNAVDMGILKTTGLKGLLYKFFRNKEKGLYEVSDYIGCMSPANVSYVLKHNPWISQEKVEICPNSIELVEDRFEYDRNAILEKYGVPKDKHIFIYGGNLGRPQGIPYLIQCLNANKDREDCFFIVVGSGTYYSDLNNWYEKNNPKSVKVMKGLPKADYDKLVRACNVGLIFLDYNFQIPNFPSRLLSYLEYKMPVIACTDPNCDSGQIANENGFGMWVPSNNVEAFTDSVNKMLQLDIKSMGEKGYQYLKENYLVDNTYNAIIKHF